VLGRQIGADERLESRPIGRLGVEALALGAQLVGEDVRDEILLGGEVAVERAPLVRPASDTTAATPAPSMPSSLKRRPAASTMRCRVASFWCLPYRIANLSRRAGVDRAVGAAARGARYLATNPSCHAPVGHRHRRPGGPAPSA
jgi:hypothetical protein